MKTKYLSLISLIFAVTLHQFCTNPTELPTSPDLATTYIVLESPSSHTRDSLIIDSVGVAIKMVTTYHLASYITHFTIGIYDDEVYKNNGLVDTTIEYYFENGVTRDSAVFSYTFDKPGTKQFIVTTYKTETSPTVTQATAYIIQSNTVANNNLPRFIEVCRMFKPHAAHQPHQPLPKPGGIWAERQAKGRKEISKLLALFDD